MDAAWRSRACHLAGLSPGERQALALLSAGATEPAMVDALEPGDVAVVASWYHRLQALARIGAIEWQVRGEGQVWATCQSVSDAYWPDLESLPPSTSWALSPDAWLRAEDGAMVLEAPFARCRVRVEPQAVTLLAALAGPSQLTDLERLAPPGVVERLLPLLVAGGLVEMNGDSGPRVAGSAWSSVDRIFHARTRFGRSDEACGLWGPDDPRPAAGATPAFPVRSRLVLPRPDLARLAATDPSLAEVMERRRSIREHGAAAITIEQLAELLFRVLAVRPDPAGGPGRHTYPSGGGRYPLETFVLVARCDSLASGLYHYEPDNHALAALAVAPEALAELAGQYRPHVGDDPQVILLFGLVMSRVASHYGSIAYALALKEVGVVFEALYLAATAMGLAPCALGTGPVAQLLESLGLGLLELAPVGEFVVGSAASGGGQQAAHPGQE